MRLSSAETFMRQCSSNPAIICGSLLSKEYIGCRRVRPLFIQRSEYDFLDKPATQKRRLASYQAGISNQIGGST